MIRRRGISAQWWTIGFLALVTALTMVLVVAAYEQSRDGAPRGTAAPAPTFSLGVEIVDASPTPTSSAALTRAPERMIEAVSDAWWRATAGECGGVPPVIERSVDQGASWSEVTPGYLGVSRIASLEPMGAVDAQVVASLGEECETHALRTYTQGEFWQSYPEVLAASTYVDPSNPSVVVLRGARTDTPCPDPHGLKSAGTVSTLLCNGIVYVAGSLGWEATISGAYAVSLSAEDLLVAHADPACSGVAVTRRPITTLAATDLVACIPPPAVDTEIAISHSDAGVVVWLGQQVFIF